MGEVIAEIESARARERRERASRRRACHVGARAPAARARRSAARRGRRPAATAARPAGVARRCARAPSARRAIAETGLAPPEVKGTGRGGRISNQDVVRALEEREHRARRSSQTPCRRRPPARRRRRPRRSRARRRRASAWSRCRRCAARSRGGWSRRSTTAAILTTFNEIDMTAVLALRERYQERFVKQHGVKLGLHVVLRQGGHRRAAGPSRPSTPRSAAPTSSTRTTTTSASPSAAARASSCPSCATPIGCPSPSSRRPSASSRRAPSDNKLTMKDLEGGTFTISNGGVYGSMLSTPILNPPQSGILGLHAIQKRPGRGRRPDRAAVDDVPGALVRPPPGRRPRGGAVPGARQGVRRGARPDPARGMRCRTSCRLTVLDAVPEAGDARSPRHSARSRTSGRIARRRGQSRGTRSARRSEPAPGSHIRSCRTRAKPSGS